MRQEMKNTFCLLWWSLASGLAAGRGLHATPAFQYLGDLPGGSEYSAAYGVSADGTYVVGASSSTSSGVINPNTAFADTEAFIWDAVSGMIGLGDLPGGRFSSSATDVSADGKTVVGSSVEANGSNASQFRTAPFRWTPGATGGMKRLVAKNALGQVTVFIQATYGTAVASSVSGNGSVVVGTAFWRDEITGDRFSRGFRWTQAEDARFLNELPAQCTAQAVSPEGLNLTGQLSGGGTPRKAYRKLGTVAIEDLGQLGQVETAPFAISADGKTIIGSYSPPGGPGVFRWTEGGGFQELRTTGGRGVGVSADGRVALDTSGGLYLDDRGPFDLRAILAESGVIDLRDVPSGLFQASAISDNGLFVVGSVSVDGNTQAWRVRFTDCDQNGIPDELERLAAAGAVSEMVAQGSGLFFSSRDSLGYLDMVAHYGRPWQAGMLLNPTLNPDQPAEFLRARRRIPTCFESAFLSSPDAVRKFFLETALPVARELHAFEMLLGNEAMADAIDPTVGDDEIPAGELGNLFAFQGVRGIDDLLEEELALLRGRELTGPPSQWFDDETAYPEYTGPGSVKTRAAVYNRLPPNAVGLEGLAYRSNYGVENNYDAADKFPQGHGDAYGYYLSACRASIDLFREADSDGLSAALAELFVGLLATDDDALEAVRDLAAAAAARARCASLITDLLFRRDYVEDPRDPRFQGLFQDPDVDRSWSMGDWARRGALGAYLDWAVVAHLAPTDAARPVHRSALPELKELAGAAGAFQERLDTAGSGLDPLGLVQNVVPFGIDASGLEPGSGRSHYEQVRDAASRALDNASNAFAVANQVGQRLRDSDRTRDEFQDRLKDTQADHDQELIEIFGLPAPDDPLDNDLAPATSDFVESQSHPDLTSFLASDEDLEAAGLQLRPAPGQVQIALSELRIASIRLEQTGLAIEELVAQIRSQIERIELVTSIQAERIRIVSESCEAAEDLSRRLETIEKAAGRWGFLKSAFKAVAGLASADPRAFIDLVGQGIDYIGQRALGGKDDKYDIEVERQWLECNKELGLQGLEDQSEVDAERRRLAELLRSAPQLILDQSEAAEFALQALGRLRQSMARGRLLLEEKRRLEARIEGDLLEERWRDLSFRVFRNAALKNYRAFFDLAARYVVLAARAYAYEFDARSQGDDVLAGIYRERRLGAAASLGGGLHGVLGRIEASVTVNNFNRPLETLGERRFSLRRNLLGIGVEDSPNDDLRFRAFLESSIVERVEDLSEIRDLAQVSVQRDYGPAIVIPFSTEIDGRNFFGRGPEPPFDNINFSITRNAKIRSFAIRLDGVDTAALGIDPELGGVFVFLIAAGDSVLRENTNLPRVEDELATPWAVVDQFLPSPPLAAATDFAKRTYNPWRSTAQSGGNFLNEIKRQRDSEAQVDLGQPFRWNTNLAGRSAWNTRWVLVIPGGQWTGSSDPVEIRRKLLQFIYGSSADPAQLRGIFDIRIIIQAYSH